MTNRQEIRNTKIQEEEIINVKDLISKILNKWYLFGISGLIGLAAAFAVNKIMLPSFEVSATMITTENNENLSMAAMFQSGGYRAQAVNIQNHLGILSSYSLTRQTLENLDWKVNWYEKSIVLDRDLYKYAPFKMEDFNPLLNLPGIKVKIEPIDNDHCLLSVNERLKINNVEKLIQFEKKYRYGDSLQNEHFNFVMNKIPGRTVEIDKLYSFSFNDLNQLTNSYFKRLKVSLVDEKANIILAQIEGQQPERESDFLNELCGVYINYGLRAKNRQSENTVNFIDTQLSGIVDSLQSAERSFTSFRSRNRIVDLSQEAGLVVAKLEEVESEESLAQMTLEYYRNLLSYLGDADKMEQVVAPSVVGITDPALNSMVVNLSELYSRRSTLSFSAQEKNPSLLSLENEILYLRQSLEENLKNLISNAQIQLENLRESKGQINRELSLLPQKEQNLVNIKRQFDLNNELYTFLLQKRSEAAITKASNVPDVRILDEARVTTAKQLSPNKLLNFIIGLLLGLSIPFVAVIIIHYLDNSVKTKEDIEKDTIIPVLNNIMNNSTKNELPVINNPHSGISESFRILRTNIKYLLNNENKKVIGIHSTMPGEGKTFVASNLAASFAQSGANVLLISGDMRKPKIHLLFNVSNKKGLSTFLIKKDNIDDIVVNSKVKNLTIIPSGPTPPNPSELIGNGSFEKLIQKAKEYFDYIIVDNAPAAIVADGAMTSAYTNINLFVVRSEYTTRDNIKQIDQIREQGLINNLSIIINDLKKGRSGYHYYAKKGYGFYAEVKSNKKDKNLTFETQ